MRTSIYLLTVAGTIMMLAMVTIVFTMFVDPYRMFGTPTVPGLTELKPRAVEQMAIAKTYQLERIAPRTLLLGNSRTEIGLDPASGRFPEEQRPVFNAAYAGRGVCTSLLMLRNAIAVRIPERIILGIDFQDALSVSRVSSNPPLETSPEPGDFERRLIVDENGRPNPKREWQIWKDRVSTTLTINALIDSLITLLHQNPVRSATLTKLGFNPLHEYIDLTKRSGYHNLFSAKAAAYRKQYSAYMKLNLTNPSPATIRTDQCFLSLVKLVIKNHIHLTLYIHPYHATYLEMLTDLGFWESFEYWKRHIVSQVSGLRSNSTEIRIIDFSGYNEFTTETIPAPGDTNSEMHWYWEAGHYKSALGEHILERIIHDNSHFGRILTSTNIESALAEIREERDHFVRLSRGPNKGLPSTAFGSRF